MKCPKLITVDRILKALIVTTIVYVILLLVLPRLLPLQIIMNLLIVCLATVSTISKIKYFLAFKKIHFRGEILNMITLYLVVTISFASAYDLIYNWTEESCFSRIEELDSLVREMKTEVKKTRDLLSSLKVLSENLNTGQVTIDPDAGMSQAEKERFYVERMAEADPGKLKETYDKKMKRLSFLNFLYFSSVTITTLGYGDIYPTRYYAKILVVFEVFVGLFLVLIYLGVIMTQYKPSESLQD